MPTKDRSLKNVDINLGSPCNNRCLFCSNGDPAGRGGGWMDLPSVLREIESYAGQGFKSLGLLGGEPSLYPQSEELIRAARQLGFIRIALCSNGARLADAERLSRWLDAGLNRVTLSVHSHRTSLEARITGRPKALEEKLAALDVLVKARRSGGLSHGLSLNTVLHRPLLAELRSFVEFFRRRGVDDFRFNAIRPEHLVARDKSWVPPLSEVTQALRDLAAGNESCWKTHMSFGDVPWCAWPWELLGSPPLLRRYCGELEDLDTLVTLFRPDPHETTERFNWKTQRRNHLKTHTHSCSACPLEKICEGVWIQHLDLYGPKELESGPAKVAAALASGDTDRAGHR